MNITLNSTKEEKTMGQSVSLEKTHINDEFFYKITNVDKMRPFFMTIVSHSNHWMFVSSNGGISAGRKNAEYSLFPYYTDDKITESAEITGPKTILRIGNQVWEPFSLRQTGIYNTTTNLYKNRLGNKVLFEEINHDLELTFQYSWSSSSRFGFVRTSRIINNSNGLQDLNILDGIQNILPACVGSDLQNQTSNLVDAYKRSELVQSTGLGIYALSAVIVDKAEPSEALKANIVFSLGVDSNKRLMSSKQLDSFRKNGQVENEVDIKAEKGAYFVNCSVQLHENESKEWMIIADVNKAHAEVIKLNEEILAKSDLDKVVMGDVENGSYDLKKLVGSSDGVQHTTDHLRDSRHFSNVMFNIMRGGIFPNDYTVTKNDFLPYLENANKEVFLKFESQLKDLGESYSIFSLKNSASNWGNPDLERLVNEYLPLTFSRRHGDPSRPWNKFTINTQNESDGSIVLDYEGNWRDIYQNWEALCYSYPHYVESMIHKFLNASTFEGYNPYRVTKDGFDWETIEADNPWSYIGYWGDHQIIYLLKFLEFYKSMHFDQMQDLFEKEIFVYANVPYKIKQYSEILKNPKDTIEFDFELDHSIKSLKENLGADGALICDANSSILHVNFIEKILATLLSKISNFVPEGGIWMNTQRPEWNDANNALVGNGLSMVTVYYLRRFLSFFKEVLSGSENNDIRISNELVEFFSAVKSILADKQTLLKDQIADSERKAIVDALGKAGSEYRWTIYSSGFSGNKENVKIQEVRGLIDLCLDFVDQTIQRNERRDNLYHAYNLIDDIKENSLSISYLSEMLEGQVAVLSSGILTSDKALKVLDALKNSSLFREDQYSYILYPNKNLAGFLQRNNIESGDVDSSKLLSTLIKNNDYRIITKNVLGGYHFNGNFKNANDLKLALKSIENHDLKELVNVEEATILELFEKVFNHKEFTGRSGTFYGYEGLGSIYWHMVSKLLLAVMECSVKAIETNSNPEVIGRLLEHYYEINEGIGVHKSPELYGAFPTDAYSHTPGGKGAQQPGMTGQVKEDILSRYGELGVFIRNGQLYFYPCLLRKSEFLDNDSNFNFINLNKELVTIPLKSNSMAFTLCQIPIVYTVSDVNKITVIKVDESQDVFDGLYLSNELSTSIFRREKEVAKITVELDERILK